MTNDSVRRRRSIWPNVLALATIAGVVIALWLPFDLNMGGQYDTWNIMADIDGGRNLGFDRSFIATRPLTYWGWILGYTLTPNSLVGFNLVIIALLIGRGLLSYALVWRLMRDRTLAFTIGILAVALSIDRGLFYYDAVNHHFSIFWMLLTLWCWSLPYRGAMWLLVKICFAALCLFTYELPVFVLACAPLLWWWQQGRVRFSRRWLLPTGVWWILLAAWGVMYLISLPTNGAGYYGGLLSGSESMPGRLGRGIGLVMARSGWGGLVEGAQALSGTLMGIHPFIFAATALLFSLVAAGVSGIVLQADRVEPPNPVLLPFSVRPPRDKWLALAASTAVVLLGVALYMPTSLIVDLLPRSLYLASLGVAAAWGIALRWLSLRLPLVLPIGVFVLVTLGVAANLVQHAYYDDYSDQQRAIAAALVRSIPAPAPNTMIVILDQASGEKRIDAWFLANLHLTAAFQWTLHRADVQVRFCSADERVNNFGEECEFTPTAVRVADFHRGMIEVPYERVVLILNTDDGMIHLHELPGALTALGGMDAAMAAYRPRARYNASALLPPRLTTLLETGL